MGDIRESELELAKSVANEAAKEIKEGRSFAMELLKEFKVVNKRLFKALVGSFILIGVLIVVIVFQIIYFSQFTTEITTVTEYETSAETDVDGNAKATSSGKLGVGE